MKFKVGDKVIVKGNNKGFGEGVVVYVKKKINGYSYLVAKEEYSDLYNELFTREHAFNENELSFADKEDN